MPYDCSKCDGECCERYLGSEEESMNILDKKIDILNLPADIFHTLLEEYSSKINKCIFYKDKCLIYPFRPDICRNYECKK